MFFRGLSAVVFLALSAADSRAVQSVSRPGVRLPGTTSPAAAVRPVPAIAPRLGSLTSLPAAPLLAPAAPGVQLNLRPAFSAETPAVSPAFQAPSVVEAAASFSFLESVPGSEEAAAAPGSMGRLELLGAELGSGGDGYSAGLRHFERGLPSAPVLPGGDNRPAPPGLTPAPASPKLPSGARGVSVKTIRTAADVSRWIPPGENSDGLIAELRKNISKMAPYHVYEYVDAFGGTFVGIDLSARPELVDMIPELQPHEYALIKKIQTQNTDIQVLVREQGKTPDLVVGGYVTELKSDMGRLDFDHIVAKANEQVYEHGRRHGLGHGGVAIDLVNYDKVPVAKALAELNDFARKGRHLSLDRIFVFGKSDFKVFVRGPGNSYISEEDGGMGPGGSQPASPRDVHALQLLAKQGRLGPAQSRLNALESASGPAPRHSPLSQARESLESQRMLLKVQKLVRRKNYEKARRIWENFSRTHDPVTVRTVSAQVAQLLDPAPYRDTVKTVAPPDAARFMRELVAPAEILKSKGISATVTFYGSARLLSPEAARQVLDQAVAKYGENPSSEEGRLALADARGKVEGAKHYSTARALAKLVARNGRGRIAVVTGGGPGIMEAANRGAQDGGGPSVGYNIKLPNEQGVNRYVSPEHSFEFENFATRKMALRHGAAALTFFPGGFGTMDELFEILTLIQTGKMARVPIVLVGEKAYWSRVLDFDEFAAQGLISKGDLSLFKFAETAEQAWGFIESSLKPR